MHIFCFVVLQYHGSKSLRFTISKPGIVRFNRTIFMLMKIPSRWRWEVKINEHNKDMQGEFHDKRFRENLGTEPV